MSSVTPIAQAIAVILAVSLAALRPASAEPPRPYTGKPFFGAYGEPITLPTNTPGASTFGLRIDWIAAGSAADQAPLNIGDTLVSIDGCTWSNRSFDINRSFGTPDGRAYPTDTAVLQVLRAAPVDRPSTATTAALDVIKVPITRYPRTRPEEPGAPTNTERRPDLDGRPPDYETLCRRLIESVGIEDDCRDLLDRLDRCEQFPDPDRLAIVSYVHRDPFKLEAVSREIVAPLASPALKAADSALLLAQAAHVLHGFNPRTATPAQPLATTSPPPFFVGADLKGHMDYIQAVLEEAARTHQQAFTALTSEEMEFILARRADLFEAFIEHKMLSFDTRRERQAANSRLMDLAGKADVRALLRQAQIVSALVAPAFTDSLRQAADASGLDLTRPVVMQRTTPWGNILVAGTQHNRHTQDAAAIYDLGGDDVYANNQASSVWGSLPSAVIVDYAGEDAYESHLPFRQGGGDMGVGILVDRAGHDSYVGMQFTQGVGFMGVGLLIDEAGDDTYRGISMHQGVGHWGAGLLIDTAGDDRYEAHLASQAVGLPGGVGMLIDGGNGADRYYCKGTQWTGYRTPGIFEGWGQGMGFGYRVYASGGVGVLVDQGGSDRFEAGNFSMGGGYFYGLGLFFSGGDDPDRYIGSHYTQGFGCHQACGVFIDEGGNDRYQTRDCAGQGLAWDEACALFLDASGDDVYEGGGFSQGATAMNGWTLFVERGGRDTYLFTDPAAAGGNTYHDGTSLSFFLDAGGDEDVYSRKPNNAVVTGGVHSIFVDLPGTVLEALEKGAPPLPFEPAAQP